MLSNKEILVNFQLRLNKLGSADYSNIEGMHMRAAINKARLEWVRRQLHGTNLSKEQDEESKRRVDDLQVLLKSKQMTSKNKDLFYESESLPEDYGWFKTIRVKAGNENCSDVMLTDLHHIEEANVNDWLDDWAKKPDFEYRQAFYTLFGNKLRVYTNNSFNIDNIELIYYKIPRIFDDELCGEWEDGKPGTESRLEFKEDVIELILDEAVSIIASDIEHINAYDVATKRKEENN